MSAAAFCTISASTKRNVTTAGKTAAATTNLASLLITPLWPMNQEISRTLGINSPREYKQTYHVPVDGVTTLPDVREADILVVNGVEYPVFWAGEWTDGDVPCLHLVVQELKQNA